MGVNERIKLIREHLGDSQFEFSKSLGINQKDVSRLETGIAKFVPNNVISIFYDEFNVNLNWLFSGRGEMFVVNNMFSRNEGEGMCRTSQKIKEQEKEIEYLKKLLEDKEEIIRLLKEMQK